MQPIALFLDSSRLSQPNRCDEIFVFAYLGGCEFGSVEGNMYLCGLKITKTR